MSGFTEQLGRKISGAKDLGGVVRAMKALAASSVGQYENAVEALDDYLKTVELGIVACLHGEAHNVPAGEIKARGAQQIGAIIFGSDQGLVGSFNEVIVEFSLQALRALPGKVTQTWVIGERAKALLAESAPSPVTGLEVPGSLDAITPLVGQILLEIQSARERGEVWEIQVFHNHPKSGSAYEPVGRCLLPLDKAWQEKLHTTSWPTRIPPQVIDGVPLALPAFIQDYLFVILFQACAESLASENASRLASMQRAEKSIDTMLDDLNRKFHRLRQEGIDEELSDVLAGFEALKKKKAKARPDLSTS
jgi:F-type H+-transporting ATPase subunit gamma